MANIPISLEDLIGQVEVQAESELERLSAAVEVGDALGLLGDNLVGHFVDACRRAGIPWSQIGSALGVSKQAAQQRFVPKASPSEWTEATQSAITSRMTPRAKHCLDLATGHAERLRHNFVGTEHLLLAVCDEEQGLGAKALVALGIELDEVRDAVAKVVSEGTTESGPAHFTPRARRALDLSLRNALMLGHNYIGTEHYLLGLLEEGEGIAGQVLTSLGAELSAARDQVVKLLSGYVRRSGGDKD